MSGFYERNYLKIVGVVGGACVLGLSFAAGYVKGSPEGAGEIAAGMVAVLTGTVGEALNQTIGDEPVHFLQPARQDGAGVTVNAGGAPDDLILLTGFFDGDPGLRLIRRDGTVLAHWRASFSELLPERVGKAGAPQSDWNIDLHGSYIEPDGSVLFNFEYQGTVKLSRCGERIWALPERTHHTIEPAAAGGYWIGGLHVEPRPNDPAYRPLATPDRDGGPIQDDLILHVSADGKILSSKSVYQILIDNGFEPLISATGTSLSGASLADNELLHLNMIAELPETLAAAFPEFRPGDLVLSIRDYNLVFVVDPRDWAVKWHQTGPWLRQHSSIFMADGSIGVFNNNAYSYQRGPDGVTDLSQKRVSDIISVDPRSGEQKLHYGDRPGQELWSVVRGHVAELPNRHLLITETDAGRAVEVDAAGKTVWEYINRYDEGRVLEMTGARALPASYFTVTDWSCPS